MTIETIDQKKARRAEKARGKVAAIRDRRRFKLTPVPSGDAGITAKPDAQGTIFPSRVFDVADETVLKDGANNSKIGGDVLVGRLKGAKIFTLTLEERATCPSACALWSTCYGNSMPHSRRWRHGPALENKIEAELAALCAKNALVLIRLHVLGDFYSEDYIALWSRLLKRHKNLYAFGFTAWGPKTDFGSKIATLRACHPERFAIRHSGFGGAWGSFTIDFPTEKTRLGDAVVCPEQRAAMSGEGRADHCGACGLCWAGSAAVIFVEH